MASLNELYYELWLDIHQNISDDDAIDARLLKQFIHKTRAAFARNEMNKSHRTVDTALIQDLGLVELELVDSFVDTGITGIDISHTILRSVKEIPRALELHNKQAFTYIGPLDQTSKPFKVIDFSAIPYSGNGKFNKTFMYAFIMNDRVYIIGNCNNIAFQGLKYINVKGVFENPEEASKFNKPDGTPCYSDDENYPLPLYMWQYIKKEVLSSDLRQFYVTLEDKVNNADNDLNKLETE